MELMSMLLLFAFVTTETLPQTLGLTYNVANKLVNTEIRFNKSIWFQKSVHNRGHQMLNVNRPSLVNVVTELQAVFRDDTCKLCLNCMERAMKAQKARVLVLSSHHPDNLYYDMNHENDHVQHNQQKRNTQAVFLMNNTSSYNKSDVKLKQTPPTNVTITKYTSEGGKIYAIKVIEITNQMSEQYDAKSTCQIYSVKKTLPCDSDESDFISAKKKVNKKSRKSKDKITPTAITTPMKAVFKKREVNVEESYVPESFMPSIEEFY